MRLLNELNKQFRTVSEKTDFIDKDEAEMNFQDLPDQDIDNDGDTDASDEYLHKRLGTIAKMDEIEEANVTANLDGGAGPMRTPRAFGKKEDERGSAEKLGMKKTQKSNRHFRKMESKSSYKTMMAEMYGIESIKEALNPELDKMVDRFVKGLSTKYQYGTSDATMAIFESLKRLGYIHKSVDYKSPSGYSIKEAVSYNEYKKDPKASPQQKVNKGIAEINNMLAEIERMVQNNMRLKQEMGVNSSHFWKATGTRFAKINERMTRISNRLRELSK